MMPRVAAVAAIGVIWSDEADKRYQNGSPVIFLPILSHNNRSQFNKWLLDNFSNDKGIK